jgi:acyl-homoserine lactone acylase PvdQ
MHKVKVRVSSTWDGVYNPHVTAADNRGVMFGLPLRDKNTDIFF